MFHARGKALLALTLFCLKLAAAQQVDCRKRTLPVSLYSRKSSSVQELMGSALIGTYRGRPVQIASVAIQQPHRVILILDTSGSMLDRLAIDKDVPLAIADDLLAHMPPNLEIGAVFFNDKVQRIISPTSDHKRVAAEVNSLNGTGKGRTALWDAISESVKAFDGMQPGDVFYAITDGDDNHSKSQPNDVSRILGSRGIRLFAFELKHEEQSDRSKFPGDSELEQMAANTGGLTIIYAPIDGAFIDKNGKPSRTTIALREQYGLFLTFDLLTITLPESPHRPETWKLALVDSQAAQKGLTLLYPKTVMPCE